MKNCKYENVDVIAFLEGKMKSNTENYQSDFDYDKKFIKKAALYSLHENKRYGNLLWMSRKNGTHCMYEKNTFIEGTPSNITWKYYEKDPDPILAFAVEITGKEKGIIKGNCYELSYEEHLKDVKTFSIKAKDEILFFKRGYCEKVPFPNDYFKTAALVEKFGRIKHIAYISEDDKKLDYILSEQSRKRQAMPSYKMHGNKTSLYSKLKEIEKRKTDKISDTNQFINKDIDKSLNK